EVPAFGNEAVCAGCRQPGERSHFLRRKLHAIADRCETVRVIDTAASGGIEQAASHRSPVNVARDFILDYCESPLAASVAQRFPFLWGHRFELFCFPEGFLHVGDVACRAANVKHFGANADWNQITGYGFVARRDFPPGDEDELFQSVPDGYGHLPADGSAVSLCSEPRRQEHSRCVTCDDARPGRSSSAFCRLPPGKYCNG